MVCFKRLHMSPAGLASFRSLRASTTLSSSSNTLHSWEDFFKIRKRLKNVGLFCGLPTAFLFLVGESIVLSQPIFDPTMTIFGFDPMLMIALGTVGGTLVSFMTGSAFGRYIYSSRFPNLRDFMDEKQRNFYKRIVRYRANIPPIPTQPNLNMDFHGEKITSVADYRKWLRRQVQFKPIKQSK